MNGRLKLLRTSSVVIVSSIFPFGLETIPTSLSFTGSIQVCGFNQGSVVGLFTVFSFSDISFKSEKKGLKDCEKYSLAANPYAF